MSVSTPNTAAEIGPALDIAVGVLVDEGGQLLIAQRRPGTPGAGYWEFPGGKQEAGESIFDCLSRELAEEIGVTDLKGAPLIRFTHDRGPRPVRLHVWRINDWTGTPGPREGQRVRWIASQELGDVDLLPATDIILTALALPRQYLITPSIADAGDRVWFDALDRTLSGDIRMLRLRDPDLSDDDYRRLAARVLERAGTHDTAVLLDRDADMVESLGAHGLHWSAAQARQAGSRPVSVQRWFMVSAHSADELRAAIDVGADAATLSPVAVTASHPDAVPLGWPGFETRRGDAALPVYALGGLVPADIGDAIAHNAQGVAAVRGFWPDRDLR